MGFARQLRFLLWKHFLIRSQKKMGTIFELCWPLFMVFILVLVRRSSVLKKHHECHYPAKALPSAGFLPFLQSYFCTMNNTCHRVPFDDDDIGRVNDANTSILSKIGYFVQNSLNQPESTKGLSETLDGLVKILPGLESLHDYPDEVQKDKVAKLLELLAFPPSNSSGTTKVNDNLYASLFSVIANPAGFANTSEDFIRLFTCGEVTGDSGPSNTSQERRRDRNVSSTGAGKNGGKMADGFAPVDNVTVSVICDHYKVLASFEVKCAKLLGSLRHLPAALLPHMFTLLRGFILVSPENVATRKIVGKMERWLQGVSWLKESVVDFYLNAELYQDTLANSALGNAFRALQNFLPRCNFDSCSKLEATLSKFSGLFVNSTDGNAALPRWKVMIEPLAATLECVATDRFRFVPSQRDMEIRAVCLSDMDKFFAGLHFDVDAKATSLPAITQYKIRMPSSLVGGVDIIDKVWSPKPRDDLFIDMKYLSLGFSFLQETVDRAIIEVQTNETQMAGVYMQQFPSPCYQSNLLARIITQVLPVVMIIAWMASTPLIIRGIVYEKEMRHKEFMKMMGVTNLAHWVGWFIQSFVFVFMSVILFVIVIKFGRVIEYTDFSVLLVFMLLFIVATIAQCFLISTFFDKANVAAACGFLIYFLMNVPYLVMVQFVGGTSYGEQLASCLSAQVAFAWGCSFIAQWESSGVGVRWSSVGRRLDSMQLTLLDSMWMLVVDTVLYLALTWYIEAVFPGRYGVPQPFCFFLTKSYWSGPSLSERQVDDLTPETMKLTEEGPKDVPLGIAVRHLKKVFSSGKVALSGVSLNFYESQITSFVGHNGAGKTTLLSIVTGLIPPTEGTAVVYGNDVRTRIARIRESLGVCPQHNILFGTLTVRQQLKFYAGLKGVPDSLIDSHVKELIEQLGLKDKAGTMAEHLSGGMQRRLSVAVAFIGDSKTVILDEPTSGVDASARRLIWDLLMRKKEGRTIILSTHFMDEADVLGDRIAIIGNGRLRCCGSSMFLKKRYGSGYRLTLVRKNASIGRNQLLLATGSSGVAVRSRPVEAVDSEDTEAASQLDQRIAQFITSSLPGAVLSEDIGHEFTYHIAAHSAEVLHKFFVALEAKLDEFGVSSYGVSETKLEEIFLKAAGEEVEEDGKGEKPAACASCCPRSKKKSSSQTEPGGDANLNKTGDSDHHTGEIITDPGQEHYEHSSMAMIVMRQLRALLTKRWLNFTRNMKGAFYEIILPVLTIGVALYMRQPLPDQEGSQGSVVLVPWHYGPPNYVFQSLDDPAPDANHVGRTYMDSLNEPPGLGIRCAKNQPLVRWILCKPVRRSPIEASTTRRPLAAPNVTCSCDENSVYVCPADAYQPPLPVRLTDTTDFMVNTTGRNITEWLLMTEKEYRRKRYGGYSFGEVNSAAVENLSWAIIDSNVQELEQILGNFSRDVGIDWETGRRTPWSPLDPATFVSPLGDTERLKLLLHGLEVRSNVKIWFNNKGWISGPAYASVFSNAVLRAHLRPGFDKTAYGIVVTNHPMNASLRARAQQAAQYEANILETLMMIMAFCIVPASFVLFVTEENIALSKHLQFVSGVKPILYWVANYIWDIINFMIPVFGTMMLLLVFDEKAYIGSAWTAMGTLCLFVLYGFGIIPMMYPFSFVFRVPSLAFDTLAMGNMFIGWVATIATVVLEVLSEYNPELTRVNDIVMGVFLIFPQYCLGRGLLDMKADHFFYTKEMVLSGGAAAPVNPFRWSLLGRNLVCLFASGCLWFSLVLLLEYWHKWAKSARIVHTGSKSSGRKLDEDEDVQRERQHVDADASGKHSALLIKNLTKVFTKRVCGCRRPMFTAVDHLCVGVKAGECFGLLGVNGAGKTTVFSMLTGKLTVTSGDALINGSSIVSNMDEVRCHIGYCPQFDAVHSLLSAREELRFYARIRGIKSERIETVVSQLIRQLGLKQHADNLAGTYSGGNKRKLSTAIALVGSPALVLLDEPTTGMDPMAKRFLWNRIMDVMRGGKTSVVLTSHSMEECEVLCHRIGIMVNGRLHCLGSTQHLKSRFGQGYTLTLKIGGTKPKVDEVIQFVSSHFPGVEVKERHVSQLRLQLPSSTRALSDVFQCVAAAAKTFPIENYLLSQTTLEDVFLGFAKEQGDVAAK